MSHPALTDNNISTSEEHLSCSDLWRLPTIEQKFNCETTENWHQTLNSTLNAKKKKLSQYSKSCTYNKSGQVKYSVGISKVLILNDILYGKLPLSSY